MVMKSSKVILSCLISVLLAATASADWESLTAEVPLSSLQSGEFLLFGDKMVSEFSLSGTVSSYGGAPLPLPPDPNAMKVQGGRNSITHDYGLKFNFSWNVISNQTVNATLSFKMSIQSMPEYDANFIKDVWLDITGVSANGTGVVNVGEEVWDVPFYIPGTFPIASLSCSKWQGSNPAYLVDYAEFTPLKEIWIRSKAVSISGNTDGSAQLAEFYQFYSQTQIPEPATMVLLGFGGLALCRRKRRT